MSRIPRWLKIVAVIFGVLLIIGLALPFVLDVDRYRPMIVSAIKESTGREAKIGKIRARFVPTVGFNIAKVELGNPPGFAEGDFITVEEIRGGLAVGPLLSKQIQIDSITLVKPKITLLTDSQGKTNYDFSAPKKPGEKAAAESSSSFKLAAIPLIKFEDVEVIAGTVNRGKPGFLQSVRATNLNAEVGNLDLEKGGLRKWTADSDLSGIKVEVAGFKDPIEVKSGDLKLRNGAIDAKLEGKMGKAVSAKGTISVADIEKSIPKFELTTDTLDLTALMSATVPTPGASAGSAGKSELTAQGKISASKILYAPGEIQNAKADVKVYTDRTEISSLTAARLTYPPMEATDARATIVVYPGRTDVTSVSAAKLVAYPPYEVSNARGAMKVYPDRIEVSQLAAAAYSGSLNLTGQMLTSKTPSHLSVSINASGLDMAQLCAAAPETKNALTGTGELKLQAAGPLGDKMLNTMTGTGNLAVRDGSFPGFNIGALGTLGKVNQILSGDLLGAMSKGGAAKGTAFKIINGDLNIASGRVASDRIHMDSSLGTMDLRGSFGFDETLNYDGQAVLSAAAAQGDASNPQAILTGLLGAATKSQVASMSIPFAVSGTFSKPKIAPGKGIPGIKTVAPQTSAATQSQQQQPPAKKSLLDLFKKP